MASYETRSEVSDNMIRIADTDIQPRGAVRVFVVRVVDEEEIAQLASRQAEGIPTRRR